MNSYETNQDKRSDQFAHNPALGAWFGFWQRYYENSVKMMSVWMSLPSEIMATNKNASSAEDRVHGSMKAYENALNETEQVTKDTTAAAFEAGNKTKARMAG